MGLLSRVANSQSNIDIVNRKKKNLIDSFFSDAIKIPTGFKYSSKLFELFCRDLNINKGSLLILDTDNCIFFPASSLNMDITTLRHLRIESVVLENQFHHYNEILTENDNRIKLFRQYFSIREFLTLNSLMLVPFYISGILSAFLLIVDPAKESIEIAGEISLNSEKLIINLMKSRKPFSNISNKEKQETVSDPVIILQEFIDKDTSQYITIIIVTMNLKLLINTITGLLPDTDSFEISNDIIKSIRRLISNSGKLIKVSAEKHILFYKLKAGTTPGLILHQLNLAISSFFNLQGNLPGIEEDITSVPYTPKISAETILEGII